MAKARGFQSAHADFGFCFIEARLVLVFAKTPAEASPQTVTLRPRAIKLISPWLKPGALRFFFGKVLVYADICLVLTKMHP
jgi:hypothetical protein